MMKISGLPKRKSGFSIDSLIGKESDRECEEDKKSSTSSTPSPHPPTSLPSSALPGLRLNRPENPNVFRPAFAPGLAMGLNPSQNDSLQRFLMFQNQNRAEFVQHPGVLPSYPWLAGGGLRYSPSFHAAAAAHRLGKHVLLNLNTHLERSNRNNIYRAQIKTLFELLIEQNTRLNQIRKFVRELNNGYYSLQHESLGNECVQFVFFSFSNISLLLI